MEPQQCDVGQPAGAEPEIPVGQNRKPRNLEISCMMKVASQITGT